MKTAYLVEVSRGFYFEGSDSTIQLMTPSVQAAVGHAESLCANFALDNFDYGYVRVLKCEIGVVGEPVVVMSKYLTEESVLNQELVDVDAASGVDILADAVGRGNAVHDFLLLAEDSLRTRRQLSQLFGRFVYTEVDYV